MLSSSALLRSHAAEMLRSLHEGSQSTLDSPLQLLATWMGDHTRHGMPDRHLSKTPCCEMMSETIWGHKSPKACAPSVAASSAAHCG